jgi:hypothetical protein
VSRVFYDDEFASLREVIESGKGYEKSASHLWPGLKLASAYAKLKACVRDDGDQRLKFGEIIALMVFNGRFDALYYACDECMHNRPTAKAPADEEARLVTVIEGAAGTLESALKQLDRVRSRIPRP